MNYVRAECYISEAKLKQKKLLDFLARVCFNRQVMARVGDIIRAMSHHLAHDAQRLGEIADEMDKLRPTYNRFLDLQREALTHEKSSQKLIAVLGPGHFLRAMKEDSTDAIGDQIEITPSAKELRRELSLWEAVEQYLRFHPEGEAQVTGIVDFLLSVGIRTSRQSVESCIKTHPQTFRARKQGRLKYVRLQATSLHN